jgi:hypothetical protein
VEGGAASSVVFGARVVLVAACEAELGLPVQLDRRQTIAVCAHPCEPVAIVVEQGEYGAVRMLGALLAGADPDQRSRSELGEDVGIEPVVAAVVRELGQAVGGGVRDLGAQGRDLLLELRIAHLRVGKLHVAGEEQLCVPVVEAGDDALQVDRRAGASAGVGEVGAGLDEQPVQVGLGGGGVAVAEQCVCDLGCVVAAARDRLGAEEQLRLRRTRDREADCFESPQQPFQVVAPVADDVSAAGGERRQHLLVGALEIGRIGDELRKPRVVGLRAERFFTEGGNEVENARVGRRRLFVLVGCASPAEPGVGDERPVGFEQPVLDQVGEAANVVLVGVRDDEQLDARRRGRLQEG